MKHSAISTFLWFSSAWRERERERERQKKTKKWDTKIKSGQFKSKRREYDSERAEQQ